MTFPSALKRLAEREPEKCEYFVDNGGYRFFRKLPSLKVGEVVGLDGTLKMGIEIDCLGQDDIDEILALIGYRYCVTPIWEGERELTWDGNWVYRILKDGGFARECDDNQTYPDKLSAAKAALIAVVEKQYP